MHYFSEKANLKKMNVNVNPYSFPYFATWQPPIYISHIFQFIRLRVVASTDLSIVVSSTHVHFDHFFLILTDDWCLAFRLFVRHACLVVSLVSSCLRVSVSVRPSCSIVSFDSVCPSCSIVSVRVVR